MKDKYLLALMLLKFTFILCFLFGLIFLFKDFIDENAPIKLMLKFCFTLWVFGLIGVTIFYLIFKFIFK